MSALVTVSRQAAGLARNKTTTSQTQLATLIHRRGLAGGSEHHGSPKVNFWEDPMHPSRWKEGHFVVVSLAGWGLACYGGYKFFTRDKDEDKN